MCTRRREVFFLLCRTLPSLKRVLLVYHIYFLDRTEGKRMRQGKEMVQAGQAVAMGGAVVLERVA